MLKSFFKTLNNELFLKTFQNTFHNNPLCLPYESLQLPPNTRWTKVGLDGYLNHIQHHNYGNAQSGSNPYPTHQMVVFNTYA